LSHKVYKSIVEAIRSERLTEPFTTKDFKKKCPGFGQGTYNAFLHKHRIGNTSGNSELFELVSLGYFRCVRPFKYSLGIAYIQKSIVYRIDSKWISKDFLNG